MAFINSMLAVCKGRRHNVAVVAGEAESPSGATDRSEGILCALAGH